MGEPAFAHFDIAGLHAIARQYDTAADLVGAARNELLQLMFDGARAGRSHVEAGDALRRALDDVADRLGQWSHSAAAIAAVLREAAGRYAGADARAAGRLG